jgi:hypothetical protein
VGREGGVGNARAIGTDAKAGIGTAQFVLPCEACAAHCHFAGVIEGPVCGEIVACGCRGLVEY